MLLLLLFAQHQFVLIFWTTTSIKSLTRGLSALASVQYLWNLTIFGWSSCIRLSNTWRIFSCKNKNKNIFFIHIKAFFSLPLFFNTNYKNKTIEKHNFINDLKKKNLQHILKSNNTTFRCSITPSLHCLSWRLIKPNVFKQQLTIDSFIDTSSRDILNIEYSWV